VRRSSEPAGTSSWARPTGSSFPANVENEFGRAYREVAATGEPQTVEAFYPEPLNRWYEVHAVPAATGLSLYFTEVTQRRQAQDRLAMLARVSAELAGALDADEAVRRIPGIVVPALGEGCLVTVVDDDGSARAVSSWHVDPARRDALSRYSGLRLGQLAGNAPVVRALHGETVSLPGSEAVEYVTDGELRALLRRVAPGRVLTTPLRGRDRTLGALTLLLRNAGELGAESLATVRDIADRVGLALDNVRLFTEQRQVAETLQRSLLTAPFEPSSAEVAARYLPAAEVARVGGDWHDAFLQPSGSTMLVIGDVVGHDTEAAAAMGQLRALLRGIAVYSDGGPAEVLRGVDAAMEQLRLDTFATVGIARFEQTPEEAERGITRMRWSSAGHPAPVVIGPDGGLAPPAAWGAAVHRRSRRAPGHRPGCRPRPAESGRRRHRHPRAAEALRRARRAARARPTRGRRRTRGDPADRPGRLTSRVSRRTRGPAAPGRPRRRGTANPPADRRPGPGPRATW
jgi:Stage II sporulation protein E (SpoIIE)